MRPSAGTAGSANAGAVGCFRLDLSIRAGPTYACDTFLLGMALTNETKMKND